MGKKLNENVPELRFPEFSQPWLIKSVSELVKENFIYKPLDGNHGNLHPTSSDYVKSGIPFVMSNNIQDGVINYSKCHHISEDLARSLQKGFSKEGDVLLTHKGTVGEVAVVGKTAFSFIMLTPQVTYYRVKNPKLLSNLFLASLFASYNFQKVLKVFAAGGTRPYIGITEQGKLNVPVPALKEQEKIASFLGAVDRRLTQLRRKQELLQTYKRGVMQKIFSQEIRFKGAIGSEFPDWEEMTLGEITNKIGSGATPRGGEDNYQQSGISLFRSMNIYDNRFQEENLAFIDENQARELNNVTVEKDDILLNITGASIARCCIAPVKFLPARVNQHVMIIRPQKNKLNSVFLSNLLVFEDYKNQLFKLGGKGGSTREALTKSHIQNFQVILPSIKEQEEIADFLTVIDRKIETLSRQIDKTEQFKKGLLQKIFV